MPLFFFTVNASSFSAVARLPGFPAGSYLDFIAPTAVFTAAFFPSQNVGIELVLDITSGYFKKLMIMPIHPLAIILSRLSEAAVQSLIVALPVFMLVLLLGGQVKTGVLGGLLIFGILIIFSMAWACFSLIAALLSQNPRLVQSMFMVAFPLLYLTTSQMPKELLPPLYAKLAFSNPFTYVLEAVRALMIHGWNSPAIWQGLVVSIVLFIVFLFLALASFRKVIK